MGHAKYFRLTAGSVPFTVRDFADELKRADHFKRHGGEFDPAFASAEDYEAAAVAFLTAPLIGRIMECERRNGQVRRFNPDTDELAICDRNGVLKTYFRPDPNRHKQKDNVTYFKKECLK